MSHRNVSRGREHESEVVERGKELGIEGHRCWSSDGRSRGYPREVDVCLDGDIFIQCKRSKNLSNYITDFNDILLAQEGWDYQFVVLSNEVFWKWLTKDLDFPYTIDQTQRKTIREDYKPSTYHEDINIVSLREDYSSSIFCVDIDYFFTLLRERS